LPSWSDIALTTSSKVKLLHAWWIAARGARKLPDRADLDPADIKSLMPNLLISEAERDPFRIRYRLVGTRVVGLTGFDFTGRYLDELGPPETTQHWLDCYLAVYQSGTPIYGSVTEPTLSGDTFTYEFGIFPLTRGGQTVEQFVSVEDYFGFQLTSAQLLPWSTS